MAGYVLKPFFIMVYRMMKFWGECVLAAAHLINRTPTQVLSGKTPHEALFGMKLSYEHIRVFRCLCYAYNFRRKKDKFGSRSRRCIFVGYPHGKKGWKVYDMETGEIFVSRDVIFHEETHPYARIERIAEKDEQKTLGWSPNEFF